MEGKCDGGCDGGCYGGCNNRYYHLGEGVFFFDEGGMLSLIEVA
jgi:hypothetical protein